MEKEPSAEGNAYHPQKETRHSAQECPIQVDSREAEDVKIADQAEMGVDSATAEA